MKLTSFLVIGNKYYNHLFLVFFFLLIAFPGLSKSSSFELISPDHQIEVKVELGDKIYYSISIGSQVLMENNFLGLEMEDETINRK